MDEPVTTTYVATCPPCGWMGNPRLNNLTALGDYDRHAATPDHILGIAAPPAPQDDDGPVSPFMASLAILDEASR